MRQQVANRHPGGDVFIHQRHVGKVGADGGVEIAPALIDQAHDRGAGICLAQRADLKARVGRDRCFRLEAHNAKGGVLLPTVGQNAERSTRHLVLNHRTGVAHYDDHSAYAAAYQAQRGGHVSLWHNLTVRGDAP